MVYSFHETNTLKTLSTLQSHNYESDRGLVF